MSQTRARHLLQACEQIGKLVPDNICIIGIDNDNIARYLNRISLSSVNQGCFEMGVQAGRLLHRRLDNSNLKNKRVLVPPSGVVERQSTDYKALDDPFVIQAMHFIRQNATRGIKVDQVLDYVGLSRSNLEQRFQQEREHSIHTEIHNQKLGKACSMLSSGNISTSEIANVCGYPSLQYMYAVFKKHFDQTPLEYREKNRVG